MGGEALAHGGLEVEVDEASLGFRYGPGVFGPAPEMRRLDALRASLRDPACDGPDPVYGIVMDVGREEHRAELARRNLLFGIVAYARGRLGQEPVRSQGHIHAIAPHSGWSPPELFEVWSGEAIVYAQERCGDDPGRCFAVRAAAGEHVIVPPAWPHFVVNADTSSTMVFAALCDRQYGFEYGPVRERGGLAWFPVVEEGGLRWLPNPAYGASTLLVGRTREYPEFGVLEGMPLYERFAQDADAVQWVSEPAQKMAAWEGFVPVGEVLERYG